MLDPDVRRMLAGQVVVYLEAEFATVAKRTGMDRPRVVIPGNPRGQLRAMLEERRPVYAELATLTVPTDDMAPEEVAADLAKRLRGMSETADAGPVGGEQPYEVVVGTGMLGALPGLVGKRAETVGRHPRRAARRGGAPGLPRARRRRVPGGRRPRCRAARRPRTSPSSPGSGPGWPSRR